MPIPHHVARPTSTPSRGGWRSRHLTLPEDLLREASRRFGIMLLLSAALWTVGVVLGHLADRAMHPGDPRWWRPQSADVIGGAMLVASLGLAWYVRRSTRSPQFILELSLWFLVLTGLAIGLLFHWEPPPPGWTTMPMLSWTGAVTLMAAAITPAPPLKTLTASLVAVSMGPVGMWIAKERGVWDYGSAGALVLMHYPDYLLAGVAGIISLVVTRLGHQVSKARELGSYQVGELLGKGGMGEVYRATHRMLARPAAIKLIRPETLSGREGPERDLAVKRFHREAEVAASLRSPHTVELYDFGATEDETLYFVMELLEGMNLDTLVKQHGAQPPNRVIHIVRQVCESLAEAHSRGLVHRDIKPANIHIGKLGLRYDFVKVLDFGLVKSFKAGTGDTSLATGMGATPGTPDYMAPEMTLGNPVDPRADIYALGCVAYFLLTGKPVFDATNLFHMIARHLNDPPAAPSLRAGTPIPPDLERLVLACLAKQPAERPQSAAELDRALAAIELPPWTEAEAAAWWKTLSP